MLLDRNPTPTGTTHVLRGAAGISEVALRVIEIYALVATIAQIMVLEMIGRNTLIPLGGVGLQVADLAMPALPVMVILLIVRGVRFPMTLLVFLAFYAVSMTRGLAANPMAAINGFRYDITLVLLMLSFATGGMNRIGYDVVRRILNAAALLVVAVSLARFAYGPNFMIDLSNVDIDLVDDWNDGRTLGAPAVIIMVIAILLATVRDYALGLPRPRMRFSFWTLMLLAMVIVSGQRTASLGFALALGLMAINRFRGVVLGLLALVPVGLFVIVTGVVDLGAGLAEVVGQNLGGRSGTFAFRVSIWQAFGESVQRWQGMDYLFGLPLGQRPVFYLLARLWTSSLHSAYVGLVPIIGFAGTACFLIGLLVAFGRALLGFVQYRGSTTPPGVELQLFFAAVLLLYGVSYEWRGILGLLIGCLIMPRNDTPRIDLAAVHARKSD